MSCETIYFDRNSTTHVRPEVLAKMLPYFGQSYASPKAGYKLGRIALHAVNYSKKTIKEFINGDKSEDIYFTSGGSEANALALKSATKKLKHIITVKTEHESVLSCCKALENEGCRVTYLDVDRNGALDLKQLEAEITPETAIISVMYVNHITGVINPVEKISEIAAKHNVSFHCDATLAAGRIKIDVKKLNADYISLSAHKINGPKGIGVLYAPKGIDTYFNESLNVPAIVGMSQAFMTANSEFDYVNMNLKRMRNRIIKDGTKHFDCEPLFGDDVQIASDNALLRFKGIDAGKLSEALDNDNIIVFPVFDSYVLRAMGIGEREASECIRITLGFENTDDDIDRFFSSVSNIINEFKEND